MQKLFAKEVYQRNIKNLSNTVLDILKSYSKSHPDGLFLLPPLVGLFCQSPWVEVGFCCPIYVTRRAQLNNEGAILVARCWGVICILKVFVVFHEDSPENNKYQR